VALRAQPDGAAHWTLSGFLGLVVVLTHGMIDDPFHGDVIFLPALFVPFALLLRSAAEPVSVAWRVRAVARASAQVFGGLAAMVAVAWVFSGARSGAYASIGALRQAQMELGVYRNGMNERWGLQDAVRQSLRDPMNEPMRYYAHALALNPANSSANRRLGQIELTFGLYDSAFNHLAAAYQGDVSDHTTRLLAGEAFAVAGDDAQRLEMAAEAWRGVPDAPNRLSGRLAWYASFIKDNIRVGRMQAALALTTR
jgi:tetratricopeptide (TPR) repeat protein